MGDDQPRPGISTFHATFSVADQCSGRLVLSATPRALGPRNCGQLASGAEAWTCPSATMFERRASSAPPETGFPSRATADSNVPAPAVSAVAARAAPGVFQLAITIAVISSR